MYIKLIILCLVFKAALSAISVKDVIAEEWNLFKLQYEKTYDGFAEEEYRFGIFKENKLLIAKHNKLYAEGKISYEMGLNHFGDMMSDEISTGFLGYDNNSLTIDDDFEMSTFVSNPDIMLPKTVDWRTKGAVTGVKSQGRCGSCWAFGAIGALEGHHFLKKRRLISLSEQNLVDCSKENHGCKGGWADKALKYIKKNHGVDTEASYPYKGRDLRCHFRKNNIGAIVTGIVSIPKGRENKLMQAVALRGPVAVAINAKDHGFQFYKRGVYDNSRCSRRTDHIVLIVGYGTENGHDYWLVKNSWSTHWGDRGYIKMARNKNLCGIADWGVYPLV